MSAVKKRDTVLRIVPKLKQDVTALASSNAELAVLGSVLEKPDVFHSLSTIISAEDFWSMQHGLLWFAMQQIAARGEEIDLVTLFDELQKPAFQAMPIYQKAQSPDAEPQFYQIATEMMTKHSIPANADTYARIILDRAIRIRLLDSFEKSKQLVFNTGIPLEELIQKIDVSLFHATQRSSTVATDIASIASEYHDQMERILGGQHPPIVPLGFRGHDEAVGGMTRGELNILAGSAGMGKTTFLLSVIFNILRRGERVILFSLEMSRSELMNKFVTMLTGVPSLALQTGKLDARQSSLWVSSLGTIADWKLDIVDEYAALSPSQFRARCLKIMRLHTDVALIAVDGLWLMEADEPSEERHKDVNTITKKLAEFARDEQQAVLLLHQYKQDIALRRDKTPKLSDLSESAGVQRNTHYVLGLHSERFYDSSAADGYTLHVLKGRNKDVLNGANWQLFFDAEKRIYRDGVMNHVDLSTL